ncbi:MAG: acyltransferase family protein [Acidobacteriia bacterium]|nr:acyltransferase family protein [Terriglobia bacterium]
MTGARPPASPSRFHSLDALRAVLMMLGVVRHAAMSYVPTVYEGWPYRDAQPDLVARWVIVFIRAFQVPVFFAIAGFFAAYLVEARGVRAFLQHRWSRIGVPLVVAWPVIAVAIFFVARFVSPFSAVPSTISYGLAAENMPLAIDFLFVHLWFLYDLMILSVVASVLRMLTVRIPEGVRAHALDLFTRLAHRGGVLVLALAAGLPLYRMQSWDIDYYGGPFPAPRLVALYGLFFAFGWMLFRRRETLEGFKRPAWLHLAAGVACFLVHRYFVDSGCQPGPDRICTGTAEGHHLGAIVFLALAMSFLAYSLFGLFLRYADNPSPRWRYMADASFWMYLVHMPVVMLLPVLLADVQLPGIVKLAMVVVASVGLMLLSYRYFVRSTAIGMQLNGRRYPRGATW